MSGTSSEVKENHKSLFLKESDRLGRLVLGCMQNLEENPSDYGHVEELVNAIDVIRKTRFVQGGELETDDVIQ